MIDAGLGGFAAGALGLMGAALAFGSARHARENLAWRRQWSEATGEALPTGDEESERRVLTRRYLSAGLALIAVAAAVAGAATRGAAAGRPARPVLIGTALLAAGLSTAWRRWRRAGVSGPRFLEGELLLRVPLSERLADACAWTLSFLFAAQGILLLRESLR